ncbi:MAG: RNA 2',3'-cyclic phosphodiesterase [Planctomycetales bacterium]
MSKLRTFIAVEATAQIKSRAVELIELLAGTLANVKWVEPEEMHWTLKFLGDVDSNDVPALCRAATSAVANLEKFQIRACGSGAFPKVERPRTLWLGVDQGTEPFVALHDAVQQKLQPLGFRTEHRRFKPHLTIGRVRRSPEGIAELGQLVAQYSGFDAGEMQVDQLIVYSSRLKADGPTYQSLGRIPLR